MSALPLYLLTAAKNQPILVELKNGETINGQLVNCDSWMNLTLKDVIQSSANGEEFLKIAESYVRGNHIKYLRLPESLMDHAKEQNLLNMEQRNRNQKRRGGNNSNYNNNNNSRRGGYNNNYNNNNNSRNGGYGNQGYNNNNSNSNNNNSNTSRRYNNHQLQNTENTTGNVPSYN